MKRIIILAICCIVVCTYSFAQTKMPGTKKKSTDLFFFELRGPVHTMVTNNTTYVFTPSGSLKNIGDRNPVEKKHRTIMDDSDYYYFRDAKGNISDVFGWEYSSSYKWVNGRVASRTEESEGEHFETTYFYDSKGNITKLVTKSWEEGDEGHVHTFTETYEYTKFDSFGNWTTCKVNGEERTRVITYYE